MPIKKAEPTIVVEDEISAVEAVKQLDSDDPDERRVAAIALLGRKAAVNPLIERFGIETDLSVRQAIIMSLVSIGSDDVIDTLLENLGAEEAHIRNEAVQALQQIPEKSAEKVHDLFESADPDVRIMAVDVVRLLAHPNATDWVNDLLEYEMHPNVVGVCLDRLCEIGNERSLDVIAELTERFDDDAYIQFTANVAKERIQSLIGAPSG